jgi:L-amino acid N-acyltransferase YncA
MAMIWWRFSAMISIAIRPAELSDIPPITAIYGHAVQYGTASFEFEPPSEAEMTRRMQALLNNKFPYLVATENGGVCGYAYAGPYHTRPGYRWTVEDSIYLAPNARRRGIGRLLLDDLIGEATARGFRQMIAVIGDSDQQASIRLHAATGFSQIGTLRSVGFKFGRWLDSVLMQRALGPRDTEAP